LNDYNVSHLFLMRQLTSLENTPIAHLAGDALLHHFRKIFKGQIIGNSGISIDNANRLIAENAVDAVAFGRDFIANPDLVDRIRLGAPPNEQRPEGYYGDSLEGFTDYPALAES
jgi:N-ethylmaleimide reductase